MTIRTIKAITLFAAAAIALPGLAQAQDAAKTYPPCSKSVQDECTTAPHAMKGVHKVAHKPKHGMIHKAKHAKRHAVKHHRAVKAHKPLPAEPKTN